MISYSVMFVFLMFLFQVNLLVQAAELLIQEKTLIGSQIIE